MNRLLASAALAALLASSAQAKPVDWTGWYWGVNAGYVETSADTARTLSGTGYFATSSVPSIEANSKFELRDEGATAGFQYGYNHKIGGIVLGGEVDAEYVGAEDTASATVTYPCCSTNYTSSAEIEQLWSASIRAKLGVPVGSALLYATGGIAFGEVEITQGFSDTDGPLSFASQSFSETLVGWTAGGGFEFPVADGLAVRIEYLYADLGDIDVGPVSFVAGTPSRLSETTAEVTSQAIRIGLNWHY